MGCPKLPYRQTAERSNFLGVWKKTGQSESCDNYYAFGLNFNSYTREDATKNKFKFQSQEHIDDLDLGWDAFKWRNHMPDIGRFFNVDPISDKYVYNSPYAFAENKVINGNELEGLELGPTHFEIYQSAKAQGRPMSEVAQEVTGSTAQVSPAGAKILNGVGNTTLGTVGVVSSVVYMLGTDGLGAAVGGGAAFMLSAGEMGMGLHQIADGVQEMVTGETSPTSDIIQSASTVPGLMAYGSENAELIDAAAGLVPGMLTGGNIKTILQSPNSIRSATTATDAAYQVLNTVDAVLDVKDAAKATVNAANANADKNSTKRSKEEIKAIANYVDSLNQ